MTDSDDPFAKYVQPAQSGGAQDAEDPFAKYAPGYKAPKAPTSSPITDTAKTFGGAAISGAGDILSGAGELARQAAGPIAAITNAVGLTRDLQPVNPFANNTIDPAGALQRKGQEISGSASPEFQRQMQDTQILHPSTWTPSGVVGNVAAAAGGLVPLVGANLIPGVGEEVDAAKVAEMTAPAARAAVDAAASAATRQGLLRNAALFGTQSGGSAMREENARVMGLSDADIAQVPAYQKAIAAGQTPAQARASVAESSAQSVALPATAIGAISGAVLGHGGDLVGGGLAKKIAASAAYDAGIFGTQAVAEHAATTAAANAATGEKRDPYDNAVANFASAALSGAAFGALGGKSAHDKALQKAITDAYVNSLPSGRTDIGPSLAPEEPPSSDGTPPTGAGPSTPDAVRAAKAQAVREANAAAAWAHNNPDKVGQNLWNKANDPSATPKARQDASNLFHAWNESPAWDEWRKAQGDALPAPDQPIEQAAAPLALPQPTGIAVDSAGNATTGAANPTPEISPAAALQPRGAGVDQPFVRARLPDGSAIPDPSAGPLSLAVNHAVQNGALDEHAAVVAAQAASTDAPITNATEQPHEQPIAATGEAGHGVVATGSGLQQPQTGAVDGARQDLQPAAAPAAAPAATDATAQAVGQPQTVMLGGRYQNTPIQAQTVGGHLITHLERGYDVLRPHPDKPGMFTFSGVTGKTPEAAAAMATAKNLKPTQPVTPTTGTGLQPAAASLPVEQDHTPAPTKPASIPAKAVAETQIPPLAESTDRSGETPAQTSPPTPAVASAQQGAAAIPSAKSAPAAKPVQVHTGPKMWVRGRGEGNAQAVLTADGKWQIRSKLRGKWQPWKSPTDAKGRVLKTFDPSGAHGYRETVPASGNVRIPGHGLVTLGERTVVDKGPKEPPHMLDTIAKSGGLNRAAFKSEGIDPAEIKQHMYGIGNWLFPKNGGMTPHDLREWMEQRDIGFLPAEKDGEMAQNLDSEAVDLVMRALKGEKIYPVHGNNAAAEKYAQEHHDQLARDQAEHEAEMAARDARDAQDAAELDQYHAALDQYHAALDEQNAHVEAGDENAGHSIAELVERLKAAGMSDADVEVELEWMAGRPQAAQAKQLYNLIQAQEARRDNQQGNGQEDRQGIAQGRGAGQAAAGPPIEHPAEPEGAGAAGQDRGALQLEAENAHPVKPAPTAALTLETQHKTDEIADDEAKRELAAKQQGLFGAGTAKDAAQQASDARAKAAPDASVGGGLFAGKAPVSKPSEPSAEEAKPKEAPAVIEDFGERLEGARKFLPPSLKEKVTDDQIASLPLSKIWPSDAHESIEDPTTAALAFAARQEIPAKPRTARNIKRWVEKVTFFRDLLRDNQHIAGIMESAASEKGMSVLAPFFAKTRLLTELPRDTWSRVEKVGEYPNARRGKSDEELKAEHIERVFTPTTGSDYYRVDPKTGERGERVVPWGPNAADHDVLFKPNPHSSVTIDGKTHSFNGVGKIGPDEVQKVKELLGTEAPTKGALTAADFEIRSRRKDGSVFINRKGDSERRPLQEFTGKDAVTQARAWLKDHATDAASAWEKVKERDNVGKGDMRRDSNAARVGEDRRNGKDVTPEAFTEAFGFRGTQFGEWVKQGKGAKDRQGLLNDAYDALHDLADLLGIPSKAISLDGSLGLSLGARGHGKNAAHFETSNLVINLTKTRGAGSLAHEWFHALDNYFARQRGGEVAFTGDQQKYRENNYITYKPEPMLRSKRGFGTMTRAEVERQSLLHPAASAYRLENWEPAPHTEGVRPVVEKAFAELVAALNASPMAKRASHIDGLKTRDGIISGDGYWSRVIERGARSFENYVISKMAQHGLDNDFLANIRSWDAWQATGKNPERYPYLKPEEEAPITHAFDHLFDTLETRNGDDGKVGLFSQPLDTRPTVTMHGREARFDLHQSVYDWLGVQPVGVWADLPALRAKHVELFRSDADVRATLEQVLGNPEYALPASHNNYTLIASHPDDGLRGTAVVELEQRGGKYRVRSVYRMNDAQLAVKLRDADVAHEKVSHRPSRMSRMPDVKGPKPRITTRSPVPPFNGPSVATRDPIMPIGQPHTLDSLHAVIDPLRRNLGDNGPKVVLHADAEGLPEHLKTEGYKTAEGVYDENTGTVHLVTANIRGGFDPSLKRRVSRDERAQQVFAHEVVGHYGIEHIVDQELGAGAWDTIAAGLDKMRAGGKLADLFNEVDQRYPGADRATAASETVAVMAEKGIRNGFMDRIVAAIRKFLRKLGIVKAVSEAEIRQYLVKAARFVRDGVRPMESLATQREAGYASQLPDPFYSALNRSVNEMKGAPKSADPTTWKQWLDGAQRRGEFKQAEREWMGLDAWLDSQPGKITREAVQDFTKANQVKIEVKELKDNKLSIEQTRDRYYVAGDGGEFWVHQRDASDLGPAGAEISGPYKTWSQADQQHERQAREDAQNSPGNTKFASYVTPGGENYRELLLTLPGKESRTNTVGWTARPARSPEDHMWAVQDERGLGVGVTTNATTEAEAIKDVAARVAKQKGRDSENFRSGHFDEPNILAHVRMNDRTGPNGEKILHVEEVQSDWHQNGRKQGYQGHTSGRAITDAEFKEMQELGRDPYPTPEGDARWDELRRLNEAPASNAVPDAPFKKEWPMLAMKRVLRYASENGYDKVTWTTGDTQNVRYDLSKQVSTISWAKAKDGTYSIEADHGGGEPIIKKGLTESQLGDTIGKEAAQKIVDGVGKFENDASGLTRGRLENTDLKLGGEGMRGFYDRMLPNEVNKYVKQWGGRVTDGAIDTGLEQKTKAGGLTAQDKADLRDLAKEARDMDYEEFAKEYLDITGLNVTQDQHDTLSDLMRDPARRAQAVSNFVSGTNDNLKAERKGAVSVHSFAITDAMRESVMQGQPMFAKPRQVNTDAFRRWFNDSKVTDKNGEPLTVYHGTSSEFWRFDPAKLSSNTGHMTSPLGFFFDERLEKAQHYAEKGSQGVPADERVVDAHLSIKNPAVLNKEQFMAVDDFDEAKALRDTLIAKGHDGIHIPEMHQWIAFEPTQIKSASENTGTFNPGNPDIRFSQPYGATADDFRAGPDEPPPRTEKPKEPPRAGATAGGGAGGREPPKTGPGASTPPPKGTPPPKATPRAPGESKTDWEARAAGLNARIDAAKIRAATLRMRELARGVSRAAWALRDRAIGEADVAIDRFRTYFDKRPSAVRDDPLKSYASVIDYQQGRVVKDPTERAFIETMADLLQKQAEAIHGFGTDKLSLLAQYFPQLWKDPIRAEKLYADLNAKRPLAGSTGFKKERVFADYEAGIKSGLEPAFDNPADAIMARYQAGERYLSALRIKAGLEELGQVKDIPDNGFIPPGFARVNDNTFNNKVVPEIVARDINNYLAPGLAQFKTWRNLRWLQNLMLSARLGFSAFHAGFTTIDTGVSHLDVAFRALLRGDVPRAVGTLTRGLFSPILAPIEGKTLLQQFYGVKSADANTSALLDALTLGGARGRMDPTDWNNDLMKFKRAWRTGDRKAQATSSISAAMELTSRWVTHHLVPYQKMASRVLLAKFELDARAEKLGKKQGDYAGIVEAMHPDTLKQIMHGVVQQVDDRLGQLAYDNLFLNRIVKDISQGTIQAVGWNIGTFNTIFGGIADARKIFKPDALLGPLDKEGKITGEHMSRVTGRLSYLLALNVGVGLLGALTQTMMTGQGPTELKDYFFPKTGRKNPDGSDERISFPGYLKDEYSLLTHPIQTAQHKLHPSISTVAELLNNQDFYGVQIHNPDDPWIAQAADIATHIAKGFEPYSIQGAVKNAQDGKSDVMTILPFAGVTPASAANSRSPFQSYLADKSAAGAPQGGRTQEQADTTNAVHDAERRIRLGESPDLSQFSPQQRHNILRDSKTSVPEIRFKRLGIVEKLAAYDQASEAERAEYKLRQLVLTSHWQQSVMNLPESDRQAVRDRIRALRDQ